jgi:hypothetical protein
MEYIGDRKKEVSVGWQGRWSVWNGLIRVRGRTKRQIMEVTPSGSCAATGVGSIGGWEVGAKIPGTRDVA